ncbi:hypothetical protein N798_00240 [Knoellia flava TL1]|uniref:Uncharacterized protein n=1 Tax=Knoellia flava TL1 TaxID=1385518 RepID=A0ABR4XIK2_9MICO|nr:hypothetical protein N798_00240 [Knoellia flava TL1]
MQGPLHEDDRPGVAVRTDGPSTRLDEGAQAGPSPEVPSSHPATNVEHEEGVTDDLKVPDYRIAKVDDTCNALIRFENLRHHLLSAEGRVEVIRSQS